MCRRVDVHAGSNLHFAEEVHRHLHPEITQKAAREAQEQDEAQKVYLALDGVLKKYGIPTKQSAYYVLRERYGITYKNPRWLEKRLKALGSYEYVQWPEAVDTRPPWISQLHLDHFARKSKERRKKGVEKKKKAPRKQSKSSPFSMTIPANVLKGFADNLSYKLPNLPLPDP